MVTVNSIRSFWNEKAKENAYWFVSSARPYGGERDLDEFWASGHHIWSQLKASLGYHPKPGHQVVEIGCGVGRLSRAIAPEVQRVDAFDISDEMLAIAKQANLSNVMFHRADGFGLTELADSSADLVLAYCVFQHLPSLEALEMYLKDMTRVVTPGGIVAFSLVPRSLSDSLLPLLRVRAFLREKLDRNGPRGIYRKEWVGIRPLSITVKRLSPIPLEHVEIFADQQLFFGRKPESCLK